MEADCDTMSIISDWNRPGCFPDAILRAKQKGNSSHDRFDCVLCGCQVRELKVRSYYNNTSLVCQYCHHAELMLLEHIALRKSEKEKKSHWGIEVNPVLVQDKHQRMYREGQEVPSVWRKVWLEKILGYVSEWTEEADSKAEWGLEEKVAIVGKNQFTNALKAVVNAEPFYKNDVPIFVDDKYREYIVWENGRPRWTDWSLAVLHFSRIPHVHAWLTESGRWLWVRTDFADSLKDRNLADKYKSWHPTKKDQFIPNYWKGSEPTSMDK